MPTILCRGHNTYQSPPDRADTRGAEAETSPRAGRKRRAGKSYGCGRPAANGRRRKSLDTAAGNSPAAAAPQSQPEAAPGRISAHPSPLRGTSLGPAPNTARSPHPRVFQHSPVLFPSALAPSGAASPGAPGLTGTEREGGVRALLPGRAPFAPPRGPGAVLPQRGGSHPGCPCPSFLRWGGGAAALPAGKGEPGELLPRDPGSGSGRKGRAGAGAVPVPGGRFAKEGPPPPGAAGRGKAGSGAAVAAAEGRGLGRVRRRAQEEKEGEAGGASQPLSEDAARIRPGKGRGKRRGSERAPPPRRQRSGARLGWEPPRRRRPPRSAPRRPAGGEGGRGRDGDGAGAGAGARRKLVPAVGDDARKGRRERGKGGCHLCGRGSAAAPRRRGPVPAGGGTGGPEREECSLCHVQLRGGLGAGSSSSSRVAARVRVTAAALCRPAGGQRRAGTPPPRTPRGAPVNGGGVSGGRGAAPGEGGQRLPAGERRNPKVSRAGAGVPPPRTGTGGRAHRAAAGTSPSVRSVRFSFRHRLSTSVGLRPGIFSRSAVRCGLGRCPCR